MTTFPRILPRSALFVFVFVFVFVLAPLVAATAQERTARPLTAKPAEIEEPFSSVTRMVELADGRLLVYDATEKKLGVAGFGGGEFTEVARQGAGPLEYRAAIALLRLPGDSILLWDLGNRRTLVMAPDGKPVRTVPMAEAGNMMALVGAPVAREMDARGRWYASFQGMRVDGRQMSQSDTIALVRITPSSGKSDTLMTIPVPSRAPMGGMSDGVIKMRAPGFPPRNAWGVFPDGRVLVIHGDTYTPEVVRPDGSRQRAAAVPFPRVAVTAKDKADHMEQMKKQMGGMTVQMRGGASSGPGIEVLEPEAWPSHKPPILSDVVRVDTKARAWVRALDRDAEAGERYDLLDVDGRLVDAVRMPKGVKLVGLGKGVLYATREDADGLVYLQKYPLP